MKRILVLCPTDEDRFNLQREDIRRLYTFNFVGPDISDPGKFDARSFVEEMIVRLRTEDMKYDGILGTDDYPACLLASIIATSLGLPYPTLRALYSCQNKLLSREIQQRVVPEATPRFAAIDLSRTYRQKNVPLPFPFFLKPVKSYLSLLAQEVKTLEELNSLLKRARHFVPLFTRPFRELLTHELLTITNDEIISPPEMMIAEEILSGRQVSVEGYVYKGDVHFIAFFDAVMIPRTLSFDRFEYPTAVPLPIQERMKVAIKKIIREIGLEMTCFNVEMIYDEREDRTMIIEINPRMAAQFADLLEKVEGTNLYDLQLALACGERPVLRKRKKFRHAASFPLRVFCDRKVQRIPTVSEIKEIEAAFPGTQIHILVEEDKRLSEYPQDQYTFRYCLVNTVGKTRKELFERLENCKRKLRFEFE